MKIQIKANARPTNEGFVGYVVVKRGLDYLWSESTPIVRANRAEAVSDAKIRKAELLESEAAKCHLTDSKT